MRLYRLDPLGGLAGDMFAAACLDALPELRPGLLAALDALDLPQGLSVEVRPDSRHAIAGLRFIVHLPSGETAGVHEPGHPGHHHHDDHHHGHHHHHRSFAEVRRLIEGYDLEPAVRRRAIAIFTRLAEAEAAVHGAEVETVTFHEVGGWDSVVDIIAAAWLIEAMGPAVWTCAPLPLGGGRIDSAHGPLPVPAPATAKLLAGFPMIDDGVSGERVTPTGAAILAELAPEDAPRTAMTLRASGAGLGTRHLPGLANALRLACFDLEEAPAVGEVEDLVALRFDVDDQSPEDLALSLDVLRARPGVLDVIQSPRFGKKGRLSIAVEILLRPEVIEDIARFCLAETTTLGVRWSPCKRRALPREAGAHRGLATKTALRPDGRRDTKIEAEALRDKPRGEREALRRGAGEPEAT